MVEYAYACTCPDFTQKQSGLLNSQGISSSTNREWNNVKENPEMYCKHIIAVILSERDSYKIPTDVPTTPLIRNEIENQEWANKRRNRKATYI